MWSRVHRALGESTPNLALVRGLVAQAIKVTTQAAYDQGNYDLAMTFWPETDPVVAGDRDAMPPPLGQSEVSFSLADPDEIAVGMSYIRDTANFAKVRGEKKKGSGKDGGGNGWQDGGEHGGGGEGGGGRGDGGRGRGPKGGRGDGAQK